MLALYPSQTISTSCHSKDEASGHVETEAAFNVRKLAKTFQLPRWAPEEVDQVDALHGFYLGIMYMDFGCMSLYECMILFGCVWFKQVLAEYLKAWMFFTAAFAVIVTVSHTGILLTVLALWVLVLYPVHHLWPREECSYSPWKIQQIPCKPFKYKNLSHLPHTKFFHDPRLQPTKATLADSHRQPTSNRALDSPGWCYLLKDTSNSNSRGTRWGGRWWGDWWVVETL